MAKNVVGKTWTLSTVNGQRPSKPVIIVPPDPPDPPVTPVFGAIREVAAIPEIVFIRGIAEYEDMGIFLVDPENRLQPGNTAWRTKAYLPKHEHLGGGTWSASETTSVVGELPTGVSYDPVYARLEYNGHGPGTSLSATSETVTLKLRTEAGVESNSFNLRILKPTHVYGTNVASINTAKGWNLAANRLFERNYAANVNMAKAQAAFTKRSATTNPVSYDNPNVLYITPGTYNYADGEDVGGYSGSGAGGAPGWLYILGDPDSRPFINKNTPNSVAPDSIGMRWSIFGYFKNFTGRLIQVLKGNSYGLAEIPDYGTPGYQFYVTKVDHYRAQSDAINPTTGRWTAGANNGCSTPADEAEFSTGPVYPGTVCFFWNYRNANWGGNGNTRHGMYIEGRPHSWLHHNNVLFDGTWNGSTLQLTVAKYASLNSRHNMVALEWTTPETWLGWLPTDHYDLHGCGWHSVYNNWAQSGNNMKPVSPTSTPEGRPATNSGISLGTIGYENRRANMGGQDLPPYPNVTWQTVGFNVTALESYLLELGNCGLPGVAGDVGTVSYSATPQGTRTPLTGVQAVFTGNATYDDWDITLQPSHLELGSNYIWITNTRTNATNSNFKHLQIHRTSTELAVTNFWRYDYGQVDGWDYDSVSTFTSPNYWQAVRDADVTSHTNPHTYKSFWAYNVFEEIDFGGGKKPGGIQLVRDKGLSPVGNQGLFSVDSTFKRAPTNYEEKHCHFFLNNRCIDQSRFGAGYGINDGMFEVLGTPHGGLQKSTLDSSIFEQGNLWNQEQLLTTNGGKWPVPPNYPNTNGPGYPDRPLVDLGGSNFASNTPVPEVEIPYWFNFTDPTRILTSEPMTHLQQVAEVTTSGRFSSAPLTVPSLTERAPRFDAYNLLQVQTGSGNDFPTSVGGTVLDADAVPLVGRPASQTRAWIWASRAVWDPVRRMIMAVCSPHLYSFEQTGLPPMGPDPNRWKNPDTTLLFTYRVNDNAVQVYEAPLFPNDGSLTTNVVGHWFDNQCIVGRTLYKMSRPDWTDEVPPPESNRYVQPQCVGINIDAVTTNPLSVYRGAAVVDSIGRPSDNFDTIGNAMDYHAATNTIILFHKNKFWRHNMQTRVWSTMQTIPWFARDDIYHNVGHYNPHSRWMVMGGGCAGKLIEGTQIREQIRQYEWAGINPDGDLVELDRSSINGTDFCISVFDDAGWATIPKACGTYIPNSNESIFFHDNRNIYGLDPTRPRGSQWRIIPYPSSDGKIPTANRPCDWACAVPEYNCIVVGSYGGFSGTTMDAKMWVYRV